MEIGLGSLVVPSAGEGVTMLVVAAAGDEMYCVSIEKQKSIRQWRHRSALNRAPQPLLRAG
jgi:hypothetical protein